MPLSPTLDPRLASGALALALLSGCAAGLVKHSLGAVRDVPDAEVRIVDRRPPAATRSRQEGFTVIVLGDDAFRPSPIAYLKDALARKRPAGYGLIELELTHLEVRNNVSNAVASAQQNARAAALSSLGHPSYVGSAGSGGADDVTCEVSGVLNGLKVRGGGRRMYGGIFSSLPGLDAAIQQCLDGAAAELVRKLN